MTITPEMKVATLLDRYPEVEEPLIARVPAFAKLRNPILRRTVARVTSLAQAAKIAGISPRELVVFLRALVGQADLVEDVIDPGSSVQAPRSGDAASSRGFPWPESCSVVETIDVQPLLDAGEFPLARVKSRAAELPPGRALVLVSPFPPVPLIEALDEAGFACSIREVAPGRFETAILAARGRVHR